jgi:CheY-like chemotaxis protein
MNMKVDTTTNGSMALQLFEASEKGYYDVVLMDIQMPILDGYETTKAIRESSHPDSNTICIIALTADDFSDNQLSLGCGMNYHITKPIDIHRFYNILQNEFFKEKTGTNSIPAGSEIRY